MKSLKLALATAALAAGSAQAALVYDTDVTNNVIFGSGVTNGSFTADRNNGVELGLRGKLRHNGSGAPENTFNSNGDGTYSFAAGQAFGQSAGTAVWSFEWSINVALPGEAGRTLDQLTYALGIDSDASLGTNYNVFDVIHAANPGQADGHWDHSIGGDLTGNGGGDEAGDIATYLALLSSNNLAQNSWKAHWYIPGFDPTVDGTYNFFLAAYDGTAQLARTEIQIIVGAGGSAAVPEPGSLALAGLALAGLAAARRRRA